MFKRKVRKVLRKETRRKYVIILTTKDPRKTQVKQKESAIIRSIRVICVLKLNTYH